MTLDEAIKHCEEKAKSQRETAIKDFYDNKTTLGEMVNCRECAKEHEQLAEWLKELKAYKEAPQGEWIVLVDADNIQTCKCSICGRIADIANREFDKFPYCHCGAKMKGGAE